MDDKPSASLPTRLGIVAFFNDCSSEVIARALPLYLTTSLGLSPILVGLVEGLAEAVSIILKGLSGWISDQLESRKPLVVFGYILFFYFYVDYSLVDLNSRKIKAFSYK